MDKLNMKSKDITKNNIEKIENLFPNVIVETEYKNGKITKAIDFELLQQELNGEIVEGNKERYQLTWPGKKEAILQGNTPINKTLRPVKEESTDWQNTENVYIEGDNLEVLKLLQESYLNKIKCIYIDPPYNTGKDFVYKDNFTQDKDEYLEESGQLDEEGNRLFQNTDSNGRYHSDWLTMMYPRLKLARNLLSEDGVIFISIDDNEVHNLRKICDEIFGERNFVGELCWESTTQPINSGSAKFNLQKKTESIFLYAKNKEKILPFNLQCVDNNLEYPHEGKFGKCRFEIIEKSDAGAYNRPTMKFKILNQYPREGKRWQIGENTARQLEKEGKVEIVDGTVKRAVYPEDETDKQKFLVFWSLLTAEKYGTAQKGKELLNKLMGTPMGFDTVKPVELISYLISLIKDEFIILDFFSGSSTTAHAVMQLNAEDGGNRKYIMVQLPEETDEKSEAYKAGYKTIAEIGKERIRRAAKKIKDVTNADIDYGFRVYKVDSSNMKDVYYYPNELTQGRLEDLKENINEDRSGLDLLIQVILEAGLPLSLAIETKTINDIEVHFVDEDALVACFDKNLDEETIREIAKEKPLKAVFRDNSFEDCPTRINLEEIFKGISPTTEIKVL